MLMVGCGLGVLGGGGVSVLGRVGSVDMAAR